MSQEHGNGGRYPGENPGGSESEGSSGAQQQGWQPPQGGAQQPPGWQPPQAPYGGGPGGPGGPAGPGQGGPGYVGPGGTPEEPEKSSKVVWIISGIALVIIAALVTVLLFMLGDDDEDDDSTATEEPTESEEEEDEEDLQDEDEPEENGIEDEEEELGLDDEDDPFDEDEDSETAEEITDINQALTQAQIEELLLEESDMPSEVIGYQLNTTDDWFQYWVNLWPTEQDTVAIRSEADATGDPDIEDFATCIELGVPLSDMDTANTAAADFDAFYAEDGASFINLGIVAPDDTPDTDSIWDEAAAYCDVTLADRGAEFGFFDIDGVRGIGLREPGEDYWFSVELSRDMGENLIWVHAVDVTSEELEEVVGAQTAKIDEYN